MAILELVNNIYEGFEKTEFTMGVFLDLKKAFDTVNHEIFIIKLNYYVPQGSVLCPLLLLIYISDLFLSSKYLAFIIFADCQTNEVNLTWFIYCKIEQRTE